MPQFSLFFKSLKFGKVITPVIVFYFKILNSGALHGHDNLL